MTGRQVRLPYGRGALTVTEDGESPWEILLPGEPAEPMPEAALVAEAMAHPAGGVTLEEMARDKATAVVILSDHTRPVPSRLLLPPMLAALRRGNPAIDITLLVATGCHRAPTAAELRDKLGEDLFRREKIVVHDCDDGANLVFRGTLPSGIPLLLNRLAAEADLLAAEGFIEPHFFAGFSGGRKSVLPGICGRATVMGNHCAALIDDPRARAGCLEGNPVHRDMEAAAELAGLAYIVNVTLDHDKRITAAVAGSPRAAHRQGCALAAARAGLRPARPGDIVLTTNGGAPLDQNVYQTVKSLATAAEAAAEGGDLIVCAACADGLGGESFYRAMAQCRSAADLLAELRQIPPAETVPDQWQYQILCRILTRHRVFFVTDPALRTQIEAMKMTWCATAEEALARARARHPRGHVVVIPDGVGTYIRPEP